MLCTFCDPGSPTCRREFCEQSPQTDLQTAFDHMPSHCNNLPFFPSNLILCFRSLFVCYSIFSIRFLLVFKVLAFILRCHIGLQNLTRLCFRQLQQPVDAPPGPIMQPPTYVSPNMAPPGLTPAQPPIPVQAPITPPPRNGKERLQQMARSKL